MINSRDDWLGQRVVMFDGKGISLKEMIRTVTNFEGAHSIDVGRLAAVEGEQAFRATMKPNPPYPECHHHLWNPLCTPNRDRVCAIPIRKTVRAAE